MDDRQKPGGRAADAPRYRRLAEALRRNLRRRKDAEDGPGGETADRDGSSPDRLRETRSE